MTDSLAEKDNPSAWYGTDMAQRQSEWVTDITSDEVTELEAAANKLLSSERDIAQIAAKDFSLPVLGKKLLTLRENLLHGRGFAVLRGLPVHCYPERISATMFYGIGCHIGHPRSQNREGHVLGHVRDLGVKGNDPNVRIYQTNERQTFHTDSADVVGLLCLKTAKSGGQSLLVSASTIFNEMQLRRPDLLELLLQPVATDRRGEVPAGEKPYMLIPVFSDYKGYLTIFYQRQYIESAQRFEDAPRLPELHAEALNLFDDLANDPMIHFSMKLEQGDMQFVHNHSLLHDRTSFVDWEEDAEKRHLLRLWLSVPGDRPLPGIFASRFGSITIGDRGGIIVAGSKLNIPWSISSPR